METSMKAINKWVYFAMNYPYGFISKVWEDEQWLIPHLESKFDYYYELYSAMGVMTAFYAELDGNNKQKLMAWVMNNYDSEQHLNFKKEE